LRRLSEHFPDCLLLHGGMTTAERAGVQARFNAEGGLLFATDAASEGLNLQHRCRLVICYELPWNPARLEQRIGRVDRIGQVRRVHGVTLVARDTAEDLVVANLARRLSRVAAALGEHDRLAAYLTEARTAGMVIGGLPDSEPDPASLPAVAIAPAVGTQAEREASRLSAQWATSRVSRPRDCDVVVSSLRACAGLPRGYVLVFEWFAVAASGRKIDRDVWAVHVDADVRVRPRVAAQARALASSIIARSEQDARAVLASRAADRLTDVRALHSAIVDRAIARERQLRDWNVTVEAVQPGLFDRRAVARADAEEAERDQNRADHDRRIAALAREREVDSHLCLAAVLIVYKGAA